MSIPQYTVFITPLKNDTEYSSTIYEATDLVKAAGITAIKQEIDSGNYDIGLYTYADLTITFINYSGKFNPETDSSSVFPHARDRAKVEVKFTDTDAATTVVFKGIVNDEGTFQDLQNQTIRFRVLSQDSILRKTKVAGGLLDNGMLFSVAIKNLLNRPAITAVLDYDAAKINVGLDKTIDDVTSFSNQDTQVVLEALLNASFSVFSIDSTNDMVVSDRDVKAGGALELFGGGDPGGRDNIISIRKFNDGLHRAFNTVTINDATATDETYVTRYGARIKKFTMAFITTGATEASIAATILAGFKVPKKELEVVVPVDTGKSVEVLDPVTVNFSKQYTQWKGQSRVPLAGSAIAGTDVVPASGGGVRIYPSTAWKVTGIAHNPKTFTSTLRLREV